MSEPALMPDDLKTKIIEAPDAILEDRDVMRALMAANERRLGGNIIDLRGVAMERLEARLDRLEDTHRSVIAAAYDNLAGTNQIHRAVLSVLEPVDFTAFLSNLGGDVAAMLKVDAVQLVLESHEETPDPALHALREILQVAPAGAIDQMIGTPEGLPARKVTLRTLADPTLYGARGDEIHSEALLRLEFGESRLPGLLALGARDPDLFHPNQGTDLLAFFAHVIERAILRWIA
ncbi:MAG: DUF484 family protein [Pseudomonadota bacterium]